MKHTKEELKMYQSLPLSVKVQMTRQRIRGWIDEYGVDGVYISFSGGKDSTVLLDIVRKDYPSVIAVYVDTGLEYPEIRDFVKSKENVVWLKPKMQFKDVIKEYGYPFISKEISSIIFYARRYLQQFPKNDWNWDYLSTRDDVPVRVKRLFGKVEHKEKGTVVEGEFSKMYDNSKYRFMLDAPFEVGSKCCDIMKKEPVHIYGRQTGRKPMTGQMAEESVLRTTNWLKKGCNSFNEDNPISNPMAFWTEQDVLQYIKQNDLEIASVYGHVVEDGQISFDFADSTSQLKTTGCSRTGCMYCGYGCTFKDDTRFVDMKSTHPQIYQWIMKPVGGGGLGYKEVIDWINTHGNLNIKY